MKKFENVILVDDDGVINFINEKTIKLADVAENVLTYTNAEDCLNFLKESSEENNEALSSNIVFLDLNMPGLDGWEFLDIINEYPSNLKKNYKIFILSSSIDPMDLEKAGEYDIVKDFISKPLTKSKLIELAENSENN